MKPIKVFFHGERLRDIYPHATRWQVFKWRVSKFVRKVAISGLMLGVVYTAFVVGSTYFPQTVYEAQAEKIVTVEIVKETEATVMTRIAKCESGGSHYGKDGQVVFNANSNGTVDIGLYQINSVWNKKATELGLDLTKEQDNKTFAKWLYENRGTEDWTYSKKCWQK